MRQSNLIRNITTISILVAGISSCAVKQPAPYYEYQQNINTVTNTLCDKKIVLLGENGFHGDGKSIAYKSDLVINLTEKCNFNAVYFESSFYDFQAINMKVRNQETITPEMVSSSMGWIRNQYNEIAPLIPYLYDGVSTKKIILGGLDDQPGSRGSFYALEQMIVELTEPLPSDRKDICKTLLKQRIWSSHPKNYPYTEEKRIVIKLCLQDIRTAISSSNNKETPSYFEMTANLDRILDRDFTSREESIPERDRSMFLNLEWHIAQAPPGSKFIVWSANTHVAKTADDLPIYAKRKNFGAHVKGKYGDKSFALGFSAAGGTYKPGFSQAQKIPQAPEHSLEARAFGTENTEIAFVDINELANMGEIPSSIFGHKFKEKNWQPIFDGIVVFRSEQPPTKTKH